MTKMAMTQRQQFWLTHVQMAMRAGRGLKQYASASALGRRAVQRQVDVQAGWAIEERIDPGHRKHFRIRTDRAARCGADSLSIAALERLAVGDGAAARSDVVA